MQPSFKFPPGTIGSTLAKCCPIFRTQYLSAIKHRILILFAVQLREHFSSRAHRPCMEESIAKRSTCWIASRSCDAMHTSLKARLFHITCGFPKEEGHVKWQAVCTKQNRFQCRRRAAAQSLTNPIGFLSTTDQNGIECLSSTSKRFFVAPALVFRGQHRIITHDFPPLPRSLRRSLASSTTTSSRRTRWTSRTQST